MKKLSIVLVAMAMLLLTACGSAASSGAHSADSEARAESDREEALPTVDIWADDQPSEDAAAPEEPIPEEPAAEEPEPAAAIGISAELWHQAAWTYTDKDGYVVEKQVRFGPLISMEAPKTATAAWAELGGSADELPDIEDCQKTSSYWKDGHFETGYYVMGTIAYVNKTDGFSFSPDKPHALGYGVLNDNFGSGLGFLSNEADLWNDATMQGFTRVFYSNGVKNYGPGKKFINDSSCSIECGNVTMSGDQWGPVRFVMCIANKRTPNEPNGVPGLDDLYFKAYPRKTSENGFRNEQFSGDYVKIHLEKIDSELLG